MAVEADFGLGLECLAQGSDPGADVMGQQVAGRVGDVDAVGAVAFHQLALGDQALRAVHVGHHQKADGVHAQFSGVVDVLLGNVSLGAVGGHADSIDAQFMGHLQMVDRADSRQQQG
ncbi:hypothetical protein D3C76_575040 [compost metagenome]